MEKWKRELSKLKKLGLKKGREKGYTMSCPPADWFNHFQREVREVIEAYTMAYAWETRTIQIKKELADVSNMCDLIFEELIKRGY